jgi:hypothetical protein
MFAVAAIFRMSLMSSVVYRRDPFWVPSYSYCTPLTWRPLLLLSGCRCTSTLMTARSTDPVIPTPPSPYRSQLRFVRLPLRSGCAAIVSNLTPARRTSCGVPRPGVHPVYRPIPSTLPAPRFCLCQQFAASAFSSIPTLGPPHTFAQWSRGASPPCVNFDYFADMSATTVSGRW